MSVATLIKLVIKIRSQSIVLLKAECFDVRTCLIDLAIILFSGRLCHILISHGAHADIKDSLLGETALHKAVRSNAIDNVSILIRCRVNVDTADTATGDTALHKAAAQPTVDRAIWNALLAAKAKINIQNLDGLTAADKAQRANNSLAIAVLRAYEQW